MTLSQKLFSFKGRINRQPLWLCNIAVAVIFNIIIYGLLALEVENALIIIMILYIPLLWISLALMIKRLHDLDKSGWMSLLMFVPIANIYIIIITLFFKGTVGPNKFGPDPLNPSLKGKEEKIVEL